MELVSVVMCTYNGAPYIKEQLESIMSQTHTHLEVIIMDDGSTDNTCEIIKQIMRCDQRISLYINETNLGYVKNFEKGISYATGYYIALSDQDDWWFPQKIERLLKNHNQVDITYHDSMFVDSELNSLGYRFSDKKNMLSSATAIPFLFNNCVSGHACMITKDLFEEARPFPVGAIPHDWWLAFCASERNGIKYINEPLVKYRSHDNNALLGNGKTKKTKEQKVMDRRHRMRTFHKKTKKGTKTHGLTLSLDKHYWSNHITDRFARFKICYNHRTELLATFKKNKWEQLIFCFKIWQTVR